MAMITDLKTDYKDDVLDTSANERRKFQMITNDDGTVSFVDVTDYLQTGDSFGASVLNAMNQRSNEQDALLAIADGERVITPQNAYDELSSCVNPENLIPYPYYEIASGASVTKNGLTFTDNGDGTVTIGAGTATGQIDIRVVYITPGNDSGGIYVENGEKYTLTGCPSGGSGSTYMLWTNYINDSNGWANYGADIGNGLTFTGNGKHMSVTIRIKSGAIISEPITFKPMLVKGSHKCPYNPYSLSKAKLRADIDSVNSSLTYVPNFNIIRNSVTVSANTKATFTTELGATIPVDEYTVIPIVESAYPNTFSISVEKDTTKFYVHVHSTSSGTVNITTLIASKKQ